jgi:signal transduction histidine kinase
MAKFYSRSTTTRIAAALLFVQLVSVGVTLLIVQGTTERSIHKTSRDFIRELQTDLIETYNDDGRDALIKGIARRVRIMGSHDAVIGLISRDHRYLAGNVAEWPRALTASRNWRVISLRRDGDPVPVNMKIIVVTLPDQSLLLTGNTLAEDERLRTSARRALLLASMLGLMLSGLGSFVLARYIGRKVGAITDVANQVAGGALDQRIVPDNSGDAFDRLGHTINHMLGRVEGLIGELRLVTDSLAHDLRSPVARMKATIERAIVGTSDPIARGALASASEEADNLNKMLGTAIQISRAEAGLGRDQFQRFDLTEMLSDLAEVYGPLAEEKGFEILCHAEHAVVIEAHRELLGQAIANLIDNALKYATGASNIILNVISHDQDIDIIIADNGPGIPVGRHAEALKRYGRLDSARQEAGAGLGLSLVATVAHMHNGTLSVEDNEPGLRAVLKLPVNT